jgi:hypothetical protein
VLEDAKMSLCEFNDGSEFANKSSCAFVNAEVMRVSLSSMVKRLQ